MKHRSRKYSGRELKELPGALHKLNRNSLRQTVGGVQTNAGYENPEIIMMGKSKGIQLK